MNNNVSLNNLNIVTKYSHDHFLFEMDQIILNHPGFMSNIENFTLYFLNSDDFPNFLSLPSLLSSSIKHLDISVDKDCLFARRNLSDLIQSQSQLLSLSLGFITPNSSLLDTFKSCSNTLTSIKFIHCDFTNVQSPNGFKYLTQLKSLQFVHCQGIKIQCFQSLLDLPDPLQIKSLKVIGSISGIDLLIQKIDSYLEYLELGIRDITERRKALQSVMNYCNQIKFLHLSYIYCSNIYQLYKIITYNNKHLK